MSSIAISGVTPSYPCQKTTDRSVPFCDRKWKVLRSVGQTLILQITSLFYKILAIGCWALRLKSRKHRYSQLAKFHSDRGSLIAYLVYGKKLITPSINNARNILKLPKKGETEVDLFKKLYGRQATDLLQKARANGCKINEAKLRREPLNEGCCLGASLDFITHFLKGAGKKKAFEAVKDVSLLFEEGCTVNGQILQSLYYSIESTKADNFQPSTFVKDMMEAKTEKERDFAEIKFRLRVLHQMQALAKTCGVDLSPVDNIIGNKGFRSIDEKQTKVMTSSKLFYDHFEKLETGTYILNCYNHAIVFIKSGPKEIYIYDPNWGTLKYQDLKKATTDLWSNIPQKTKKSGSFNLGTFRCTLTENASTESA